MSKWSRFLSEKVDKKTYRIQLDFRDDIALKEWVVAQADKYKVPYSKIIKALIRNAMESSNE